jgi:deoxyribose-phosphate aldolase
LSGVTGIVGPVAVASDHGGFELKEAIERHLLAKGVQVLDVGTHSKEPCDYPVFAGAAAQAIASGQVRRAIAVDGAGIGSCMVGNKVPGVRAGMAFDVATAKNAREHNDANLLTLGAGYLDVPAALAIVDVFLTTECTVDRHKRRVAMIDALDAARLPKEAGPPSPARSSLSTPNIPSGAGAHESLVQAITQVLTQNPGLLATVLGGAGDGHRGEAACPNCTGCGHCVSKRTDAVRSLVASTPGGVRLAASLGVGQVPADIAKLIDHTLLKPEATYADIDKLCDEAAKFGFASVCVNPMHVKRCAARLRGAAPVVCTVIGFPLGSTPREIKALEARKAIRDGAREIDMVLAIGALKSGDHAYVYDDIRTVSEAVHEGRALLKVIIETALLTDEEKVAACVLAKRARADFVKTSTGFAKGGATAHDVALMARAVEYKLGVKASGGVSSAADAQKMITAGATRIGASVGVKIAQEARGQSTGASAPAGGGY